MDEAALDFALIAWREDGRWRVDLLPARTTDSLDGLTAALRAQPGEIGSLGFVAVAEDFFVAVRISGEQDRVLLSDVTAAHDWPLAKDVVERLGIPVPGDDELEEMTPAGDMAIFDDLGVSTEELELLCADLDLYPDEMLASIAARIGFGEQFDATLEALPD